MEKIEQLSENDLNLSGISLDIDESFDGTNVDIVKKFTSLPLSAFTKEDDESEEWTNDFDFSFSNEFSNHKPKIGVASTTTNIALSGTSSISTPPSSEDEDWDALFDEKSDANSSANTQLIRDDLNNVRQLIIADSSLDQSFGDTEDASRRQSSSAEDAILLRSLRSNTKHKRKLAETPPSQKSDRNKTTFTFSPSLVNKSTSTGHASSATSINELECQYRALLLENSANQNKKKSSVASFSESEGDSSDDGNDSKKSILVGTTTNDSKIKSLERQLASSTLEVRDFVRSVHFHVRVRERLVQNGLGTGDSIVELIYVTEVIVSLRMLLGEFQTGISELKYIIRVLVQWITPNSENSNNVEYGICLSVMEHVQCLRLLLARICLESGDENIAVSELQGLLEVIKQTEISHQKKRIKLMTVHLWLAEAYLRVNALEDCSRIISAIRTADFEYRKGKIEKNNKGRTKVVKDGFATSNTTLLTQHSLHSLYEPTPPPSFGIIVIRSELENGRYHNALGCCAALVDSLTSVSSASALTTSSLNIHRGSHDVDEESIKMIAQVYLLKAKALSGLASTACTTKLPLTEVPNWMLIGIYKEADNLPSVPTKVYTNVSDVVHAASVHYYKARKEYDLLGDMNQSLNCEILQLELWMEYLYMPVIVHGAKWCLSVNEGDDIINNTTKEKEQQYNTVSVENDENSKRDQNINGNNNFVMKGKKIVTSKANTRTTDSRGFGRVVDQKDVLRVLQRCLHRTKYTCRPLQTVRCHLMKAEYSALVKDEATSLSYFKSARDLFLEMYVDGATIPLVRDAPTQYGKLLLTVLRRLVRFLFCSTNLTCQNILLVDCLLLTEIDFNRKLSAPLSMKKINGSLFAFHDVEKDVTGCGNGKSKKSRRRSSKKHTKNSSGKKSDDAQFGEKKKGESSLSVSQHVWGLLHRLKMSTEQFSRYQSISMEKMMSNHLLIVQNAHSKMSEERVQSRQPTLNGTDYNKLLKREMKYHKNMNFSELSSSPSSLLESFRRTMYIVAVGSSAVISYALNTNTYNVVYVGGRDKPYWKMNSMSHEEDKSYSCETMSRRGGETVPKGSIPQAFHHVTLNSLSRRYLMLLLSTTKQQQKLQPQKNMWEKTASSWSKFVSSWGQHIAAATDEMCRIAEMEEQKDGLVPHGRSDYDNTSLGMNQSKCGGCGMFAKKPIAAHNLRSFGRPLSPVVVLVSSSLTMFPFEDILNGGVCNKADQENKEASEECKQRHYVTRSLSFLSMASITWSNRKYLERLNKGTKAESDGQEKKKKKRKSSRANETDSSKSTTKTIFSSLGASANTESNIARSPQYVCFSYDVNQPRLLRLCERFRQFICLRTLLNNTNHSTRSARSSLKEKWLNGNLVIETSSSPSSPSPSLHDRVRRAGTHTMHLPFQTPIVRHGRSPNMKIISSKYPQLSILHVTPSDINRRDVITWVESKTNSRKKHYPVILLTLADLCELGEPLLQLLGWIQDCTLIFVPSVIYEKTLLMFHDVEKSRRVCLMEDRKIQSKIAAKKRQIKTKMMAKGNEAWKEANQKSKKMRRSMEQLKSLLLKRELPREWSTASSTLMSTIDLLRQRYSNMPIVVLNGPHN
jgi:hypothetical protein